MPAKSENRFATAFALAPEVKAKAAPNLQNRKWLNFQDKIDRKSKVSKLNDVETVETVEGAEAIRNGCNPGYRDPRGHLMESLSPRNLRSGGT
jgi:hypothetical protein